MERIDISLNSKKDREVVLVITSLTENYGNLIVKVSNNIKFKVKDTISFKRYVSSEEIEGNVCIRTYTATIDEVIDGGFIIKAPKALPLYITSISGNCVSFNSEHNVFAPDLIQFPYTIGNLGILKMCDWGDLSKGVTPEDFISGDTIITENLMCESGQTITRDVVDYCIPRKLNRYKIFGDNVKASDVHTTVLPTQNEFYFNNGGFCDFYSGTTVSLVRDYFQIPLSIGENTDYAHLMQEENITSAFINNAKASIVPEVIDYEKVKYSPYVNIKTTPTIASSITFNLHFRKRSGENWELDGRNWNTVEWNLSDVLGWLNFTDSDVQYQKMKIKKSFIRLSFYTTNDPLTQKLLFYSTVFFDSGDLYGRFVKVKNTVKDWPQPIINYSGTPRVDSQFVIKNEFNYDKSSEGFYLYLFASDAPKNTGKTIYMKVEFNHAGVGKTIPMIPATTGVTLENYMKKLYIPLTISYINNKYMYGFELDKDKIFYNEENDNIIFNLFEPLL